LNIINFVFTFSILCCCAHYLCTTISVNSGIFICFNELLNNCVDDPKYVEDMIEIVEQSQTL